MNYKKIYGALLVLTLICGEQYVIAMRAALTTARRCLSPTVFRRAVVRPAVKKIAQSPAVSAVIRAVDSKQQEPMVRSWVDSIDRTASKDTIDDIKDRIDPDGTLNDDEVENITGKLQKFSLDTKQDLRGSRTYQEIHRLLKFSHDSTDLQHDRYRALIGLALDRYYLFLPEEEKSSLIDTIVQFSAHEARYAGTHYVLYHGTNHVLGLILRTALHALEHGELVSHYWFLRNCATKIPKDFDELLDKEYRYKRLDQNTVVSSALLAVNLSVVGSIGFNGENSLAFITSRGLGGVNAQESGIIDFKGPVEKEKVWQHELDNCDFDVRQFLGDTCYELYWDRSKEKELICKNSFYRMGALVQILIPKKIVDGQIRVCGAYANNIASESVTRDALEGRRMVNTDQARVLLRPEIFNNPKNGIIMNTAIFGNKKKLHTMTQVCLRVARSLKNIRDTV